MLNEPLIKEVLIVNERGLHAKSAGQVVKIAKKAQGTVWIIKGKEKADAASILDLMALYCPPGTRIRIAIDNPVDIGILKILCALVENGFDEALV